MKSELVVFKKNKPRVIEALEALKKGDIDYVDGTTWSFSDKFYAFLLSIGFFEFTEETYPSPRVRKTSPFGYL